ncbi:EAL domain-containing protein [Mesorhizobium amorphae]|uniref:EAL domain-containing protein n=1 Tax=Mesorhizobium amorphae TaxID=71433 RepID=UPI0031F4A622
MSDGRELSCHRLLEALPAAIYTTDADGHITFFNQAAADFWGGRPELGKDKWCGPWRLFLPDGRTPLPHDQCPMAVALKENRPVRGAKAVAERADGTRVTFIPYPTPLRDASGDLVGAVNMLVDITDEQALQSLKESEAGFRLLFESNPVPMWVYDRQTLSFLEVNEAAVQHYGYSRDQFLSMSLLDIRPEEDKASLIDTLQSEKSWRHHKANGEVIEVLTYARELTGRCNAVLVAVVDITQRKAAEDELKRTHEFLDLIIETIPSIVLVREPHQHRLVLINKAGEELLGRPREELFGKNVYDLVPKEQADFFTESDRELLSSGKPVLVQEEPVTSPSGCTRILRTIKMPMRRSDGQRPFLLGISEDITDRKRADAQIAYLAHYDQLTGLANRVLFHERARGAVNDARSATIMLLDLDDFKVINDSLGHQVGDLLLAKVAASMLAAVPRGGTVARFGGDEFAVLIPLTADPLNAAEIAKAVLKCLGKPFEVGDRTLHINASVGIALCPAHGCSVDDLIANADLALYRAKEHGGSVYRLFEPSMRDRVVERERLSAELRIAFEAGELELFYQPQIRLSDGQVVGAEALLRWNHPQRGVIAPSAFLDVLETSALADAVGDWTIDEACRQLVLWRDHGVSISRVAVNLFAAQLRSGNLAGTVKAALSRHNLEPPQLELEITENIALVNDDHLLEPLRQLYELGVGITLDDFGTGYASLSTLKRIPLTRLKIDRGFVRDVLTDPYDAAIVTAVLTLGRKMGFKVVAEGIENPAQEAFLMANGCEKAQGYLYSKPVDAMGFAHWFLTASNGMGKVKKK